MQYETSHHRHANTIFAINLLVGILLFSTVVYFYDGHMLHRIFLSSSALLTALSLAIVNRRDLLKLG